MHAELGKRTAVRQSGSRDARTDFGSGKTDFTYQDTLSKTAGMCPVRNRRDASGRECSGTLEQINRSAKEAARSKSELVGVFRPWAPKPYSHLVQELHSPSR